MQVKIRTGYTVTNSHSIQFIKYPLAIKSSTGFKLCFLEKSPSILLHGNVQWIFMFWLNLWLSSQFTFATIMGHFTWRN